MKEYKLQDIASVIRSKNSGPYELTFDVIFKEFEMYEKVKEAKAINEKEFALLYNIPESDIISLVYFDPAKAVRVALENAASVAGLFLTTECVIIDDIE